MAVSLKLDDDLRKRVGDLALAKDRSPHWIMRQAIEDYVTRQQSREDFKSEALKAWRDYKETGLHITGEEVFDWLATWGTDEAADAPECHI